MKTKVLIIGAGLTGLSAAYHLEQAGFYDYLLLEAAPTPGGLCKSTERQGFTFDKSGHLLHLRDPYALDFFRRLLPLHRLERNAVVYTQGVQIPFPFQAHTHLLPQPARGVCQSGLKNPPAIKEPKTLQEWGLAAFGPGVYQYFLKPYNTKLWGADPARMTAEWCGAFIPPAQAKSGQKLGYNAHFYYPVKGGAEAVIRALAARVKNLHTHTAVHTIRWPLKTARTSRGPVAFERVLSTAPLPDFLRLGGLGALAKPLTAAPIRVLNVAVKHPFNRFHWAYFPDEDVPFYRVGVQSAFSPANAPEGCASFYVELPGNTRPSPQEETRILSALAQKGIIKKEAVLFTFWQYLPHAYALYDFARTPAVQQAVRRLEGLGALLAGRYGLWEYSFMERGFLQGRQAALDLLKDLA